MLGWIARIGDAFRQRNEIAEMVQENAGHEGSRSEPDAANPITENLESEIEHPTLVFGLSNETKQRLVSEAKAENAKYWAAFFAVLPDIKAAREGAKLDEQALASATRTDEQAKAQGANKIDSANRQGLQSIQQANPTADRIAAKLESYGASSSAAPAKESSQDLGAEL